MMRIGGFLGLLLALAVPPSSVANGSDSSLWLNHEELQSEYPCLAASRHRVTDREKGFETVQARYMGNDGKPFPLTLPYNRGTVIWCLNKKVGSTRWKQLLHRHMGVEDWKKAPAHKFTTYRSWEQSTWEGGLKPVFETPDGRHPRFLFVRSPFNRVLSGYLNKIATSDHNVTYLYTRGPPAQRYPIHFDELGPTPKDFATFVMDLWGHVGRYGWQTVNGHFQPISEGCGIQNGFEYDFILKSEEIESWYPDLVRMLGLQPSVLNEWLSLDSAEGSTKPHTWMEEDCFFHGTGERCSDMAKRFEGPSPSTCFHGDSHMPSTVADHYDSGKATAADRKMKEFYTPSLLRVVAMLYREDIQRFGYTLPSESLPIKI